MQVKATNSPRMSQTSQPTYAAVPAHAKEQPSFAGAIEDRRGSRFCFRVYVRVRV